MAMIAPPLPRPTAATKAAATSNHPTKSQRPHNLQRRSTLKRSIDDTLPIEPPSSPSKRSRVTFDSDVEVVSDDDEVDLDPLVMKEQVRRALERHRNRDDESYEGIRSVFTTSPDERRATSTKVVNAHLQALLANVTSLSKECSSLVNAVLFSEWIGRDDIYYALFVKFITNLAAAQRGYQNKIMEMLVEMLGPQKTRRLSDCKPVKATKIYKRIMQAIQYITSNVPSAPASLADRISAKLEFEFDVAEDRMSFVRNFMQLIKYVPELTNEIIVCILRQLVKLDVSIQENLDDIEDEVEEELLQHMSSSQALLSTSPLTGIPSPPPEDDDSSSIADSIEEEEKALALANETREETARRKLKEDIKQVDTIMDILFIYYTTLTTSTSLTTRHSAIEQLLSHFHTHILPSYRSRHPQFLIFHFAQSDPVIVDSFVASCVKVLFDPLDSPHTRHAAAAYFSGFVGRGAHVSSLVVHDCLDLLCDELTHMRTQFEPSCRGPDLKRYGDFYAVFQAILYIFCFRWRDIATPASDLDDDDELTLTISNDVEYHFEDSLRDALHTAIYSPLNPLRVCTPVIVEQFAKLSYSLQFCYIFSKIEENKHVRVATNWRGVGDISIADTGRDMSWVGDNGMLEGYFPYDPYQLPVSKRWLEGDYVEWKGIPGEDVADSEDEDENENEDNAAREE